MHRARHEIFTQGHWLIAASLAEQIAGAARRWLEEMLESARGHPPSLAARATAG